MKPLIFYAHAKPRSFNRALFQAAQETRRAAGHTLMATDVYTMNSVQRVLRGCPLPFSR
jgi:putative NADPH-quinone reductase